MEGGLPYIYMCIYSIYNFFFFFNYGMKSGFILASVFNLLITTYLFTFHFFPFYFAFC